MHRQPQGTQLVRQCLGGSNGAAPARDDLGKGVSADSVRVVIGRRTEEELTEMPGTGGIDWWDDTS